MKIPETISRRDFNLNKDKDAFYINALQKWLNENSDDLTQITGKVPKIPPDLIYTEEIMGSLEQMTKLSKMQLGMKISITGCL